MTEEMYTYWLHNIPTIGNKTCVILMKRFGNAEAVYHMTKEQGKGILNRKQWEAMQNTKQNWDLQKEYEKVLKKGIGMVLLGEKKYPARLGKIANPPFVLYYLGKMPEENRVSLAIIGARECSEYGRYMAQAFAERAVREDVDIISGMARGIDGIGQRAALEAGGQTYAVLGCGVDICYPYENRNLYENIKETGGILSPYPPGMKPAKTMFPYRNEIVAGLSDAVLVVEARQKSGTLITVDMALEQGKDVYAVPGRLTDRLSDGCNYLIRQGAGIALTPEDVLMEMKLLKGMQEVSPAESAKRKREMETANLQEDNLWEAESGVLAFVDFYPLSSDEIYEKMLLDGHNITLAELLGELVRLCMAGKVKQVDGNTFVKGAK